MDPHRESDSGEAGTGLGIAYGKGPGRFSYLKLIMATYPYAAVITLASAVGMVLVTLGMSRRMWFKTPKTGFTEKR